MTVPDVMPPPSLKKAFNEWSLAFAASVNHAKNVWLFEGK